MRYDIVANERLMKPDDWNFVVAVFLIGANWQVRTYVPSDPAALLSKVMGVFVGWDHEPLPQSIARWKVKEYKINKNARHGDYQVVQALWHDIEDATATLKKKH
jgi:parafibromin